jgi:hypothetical protein
MQEAFYTTTAQTFAKAKSSQVRYLYSMLRKRQGANELTRRGMLDGNHFNGPQLETLKSEMMNHFEKMQPIQKTNTCWLMFDFVCCGCK